MKSACRKTKVNSSTDLVGGLEAWAAQIRKAPLTYNSPMVSNSIHAHQMTTSNKLVTRVWSQLQANSNAFIATILGFRAHKSKRKSGITKQWIPQRHQNNWWAAQCWERMSKVYFSNLSPSMKAVEETEQPEEWSLTSIPQKMKER